MRATSRGYRLSGKTYRRHSNLLISITDHATGAVTAIYFPEVNDCT